jgi:hypothetical protein
MTLRIDRCTCSDRTFAEIAAVAREAGLVAFDQLVDLADFGKRCRLCHPYVRRMLVTGETEFSEILVDSSDATGARTDDSAKGT